MKALWSRHGVRSGITPQPDWVRAIVDINPPQDARVIQRFLGICNYLSRLTPNLSEIVKPLTELTHVDAVWSWSSQHDKAFSSAKSAITNATTLKFFDIINKPCLLQVDASDTCFGGVLLQDGQPVAFTSSTLSPTGMFGYQSSTHEVLPVFIWETRCDGTLWSSATGNYFQKFIKLSPQTPSAHDASALTV